MIKEISFRCKVYLGNYENIEVSIIGDDNEMEIISKTKSILSMLGNGHPPTKACIEAYIQRVFGDSEGGDVKPLPKTNPENSVSQKSDENTDLQSKDQKDQIASANSNRYIKMSGKQCIICGREVTVHEAEVCSLFISGGRVKCKACMNIGKK